MAVYVGAEGAANGTDVSSATLTAGGDTASVNIAKNNPATIRHSTARSHTGTRSIQFAWAANTAGYIRWSHDSNARTVASTYLWLDNTPANYLELLAIRYASGQAARFALSNGYATLTATSTVRDANLIPTGVWLRVEIVATPGGTAEAYTYLGDAAEPYWSATSGAVGNGAPFTLVSIGTSSQPTTATTAYFDDFRAEERATGLLGPYPPTASFAGTLALNGAGALNVAGSPALAHLVPLLGAGDLGVGGSPGITSFVPLSGVGSSAGSASLAAAGALSASASGQTTSTGTPSPVSTLPLAAVGVASFAGSGYLRATGRLDLTATGSCSLLGSPTLSGTAGLGASGSAGTTTAPHLGAALYLDGDGQLVLIGVGEQVPVGFTPYRVSVEADTTTAAVADLVENHRAEVLIS